MSKKKILFWIWLFGFCNVFSYLTVSFLEESKDRRFKTVGHELVFIAGGAVLWPIIIPGGFLLGKLLKGARI